MLHIHASRYPQQGALSLVGEMKKTLRRGRRAYFLVPSQFTVEAEIFLFHQLDTDILFQAQVKSFASLEREIADAGQRTAEAQLSEAGRRMLLRMLLDQDEDRWPALTAGSRREGFTQGLLDQLKEFKEYGISPDFLRQLAAEREDAPSVRDKLQALAEISQDYADKTQGIFQDHDDFFADTFEQLDQLDLFKSVDFYFDAFHSFSQLELQALAALLRQGGEVHISVILDTALAQLLLRSQETALSQLAGPMDRITPDAQAFTFSAHFIQQLQTISQGPIDLIDAAKLSPASAQGQPASAIAHIASNVFSYLPQKKMTGSHLFLRRYRNTEAEVEATILEVRQRVMSGQARLRDIQIILTNEEEYADLLRSKLEKEKLSYFIDQLRSIDYHPLIQWIESMLDCLVWNFKTQDVLRMVKTGLLNTEPNEEEIYQRFVERRRIRGQMFFDCRYFSLDPDFIVHDPEQKEKLEREYGTAARINQMFVGRTGSLRQSFQKEQSGRERTRALADFLLQEPVREALARYEEKLGEKSHLDKLEEDRQLWDALMDLLDELYLICDDEPMPARVFAEMVKEGLRGISLGIIPPYQDSLLISSLTRSRALERPYVWILGLSSQYIPSPAQSTGILSRQELDLMRSQGYFLPSMQAFQREEERLNFYSALVQAGKTLTLSCAMKSRDNQELEISYWLRQVQASSADAQLEDRLDLPFSAMVYSHSLTESLLPRALQADDPGLVARAQAFLEAMKKQPGWQESARRIEEASSYNNERVDLPEDLRAHFILSQQETSISQLESYAACPYLYFVQYILQPEELVDIVVDQRDLGSLIHAGLNSWARSMGAILETPDQLDPQLSLERLNQAYEKEVHRALDAMKRERPDNQMLFAMTRKTLEESHRHLLRQIQAGSLESMRTELSFGSHAPLPALPILREPAPLNLAGRIDRLDYYRDQEERRFIQLIDYKSGEKGMDLSRMAAGLDLQLPLYSLAVSRALQAELLGFFYFHVTPPDLIKIEEPGQIGQPDSDEGKLDGYLVDDARAWAAADPALIEENASGLYTFKGRRKDLAAKDNVLSPESMKKLLNHSLHQAQISAVKRAQGKISPHPFRRKAGSFPRTACQFCSYRSICRFERRWQYQDYVFIDNVTKKDWLDAE